MHSCLARLELGMIQGPTAKASKAAQNGASPQPDEAYFLQASLQILALCRSTPNGRNRVS